MVQYLVGHMTPAARPILLDPRASLHCWMHWEPPFVFLETQICWQNLQVNDITSGWQLLSVTKSVLVFKSICITVLPSFTLEFTGKKLYKPLPHFRSISVTVYSNNLYHFCKSQDLPKLFMMNRFRCFLGSILATGSLRLHSQRCSTMIRSTRIWLDLPGVNPDCSSCWCLTWCLRCISGGWEQAPCLVS